MAYHRVGERQRNVRRCASCLQRQKVSFFKTFFTKKQRMVTDIFFYSLRWLRGRMKLNRWFSRSTFASSFHPIEWKHYEWRSKPQPSDYNVKSVQTLSWCHFFFLSFIVKLLVFVSHKSKQRNFLSFLASRRNSPNGGKVNSFV